MRGWHRKLTLLLFCLIVFVAAKPSGDRRFEDDDQYEEIEDLIEGLHWHNPWRPVPQSHSKLGVYKKAAVASDGGPCSIHGAKIMKKGGSVVDAAIATLLCNGLEDLHSMGIGGGFFMTIYSRSSGEVHVIDARETAPLAANKTMYEGRYEASLAGGLAVAVPGEIQGYWMAHQKFGRLPWRRLFKNAIAMAKDGYPLSEAAASALKSRVAANETQLETLRPILYDDVKGRWKVAGDIVKNPKLAATLKKIAEGGAKEFYEGQLAKDIEEEVTGNGGIVTAEDLSSARARAATLERKPVDYAMRNGWRILGPPPPASACVVDFMLNVLESLYPKFPRRKITRTKRRTLRFLHRSVEAMKFAYAKRTFLGDQDFIPVKGLVANLTSHEYGDDIAEKIDDVTHPTGYYGPDSYLVEHGTSHNSFLSPDGDAVSVTSTINSYFGSKFMGAKTGILYNNEMNDFSIPGHVDDYGIEPSPYNWIEPKKKPMSSMAPIIILDEKGNVRMVVGASGGSKISTGVVSVVRNHLWLGQNIKEAIDMSRLHHQLIPRYVEAEEYFPVGLLKGLENRYLHNTSINARRHSVVQGIAVDEWGSITANCDFRKGGYPAGY